jgi:DNA replication protein DnaC
MEDYLNSLYDEKVNSKEIARKYDVMIFDEFFNEYHTNSEWARKKIQEMLKIRDENKLMTICTSNYNPKDFSLLYGKSIMSMLKGTFFFFHLDREVDGRIENMLQMFDDFGF